MLALVFGGLTDMSARVPAQASANSQAPARMIRLVNTATVQYGSDTDGSATCPSGTFLLSAGYEIADPTRSPHASAAGVPPVASYPSSAGAWSVSLRFPSVDPGAHVSAIADCLQTTLPMTTQLVSSNIPASNGDAVVHCPAGTIVTGGGYVSGWGG
jgi:hypothetical protein